MDLTIIAACDAAWGIGLNNRLPWSVPADLKHFRERTMDRHLIMGRKTYESLPVPLKGRHIHVASQTVNEGIYGTVDDILETGRDLGLAEMLVAGGAEIYRLFEPLCSYAEITRIPGRHECDAYMIDLASFGWRMFATKPLTNEINIEHWMKP